MQEMRSGSFCGLGCEFGVGVHFAQREVPEYKTDAACKMRHQYPECALCLQARGAFVIAIFNQCDSR